MTSRWTVRAENEIAQPSADGGGESRGRAAAAAGLSLRSAPRARPLDRLDALLGPAALVDAPRLG